MKFRDSQSPLAPSGASAESNKGISTGTRRAAQRCALRASRATRTIVCRDAPFRQLPVDSSPPDAIAARARVGVRARDRDGAGQHRRCRDATPCCGPWRCACLRDGRSRRRSLRSRRIAEESRADTARSGLSLLRWQILRLRACVRRDDVAARTRRLDRRFDAAFLRVAVAHVRDDLRSVAPTSDRLSSR